MLHNDASDYRAEVLQKQKWFAVHVHVSDSRETLCDAENSTLPVDVDNRETCCVTLKSDLRARSRERS